MNSNTMLSRSGRSDPGGKLTQRLDVPVSEELNERAIVAASHHGKPKAEFLRELLERALTDGCWFPLTPAAARSLDVLCALHDQAPGEYLADLVECELARRFSMQQMIARQARQEQWDESPMKGATR